MTLEPWRFPEYQDQTQSNISSTTNDMYVNTNSNIPSDVEPISQLRQQQQQQQQQPLPASGGNSSLDDCMPGDYISSAFNSRRGVLNGGYNSILKLGTANLGNGGGGGTNVYLDPSVSSSGSNNGNVNGGAKSAAAAAAGGPIIAQRNPIYQSASSTAQSRIAATQVNSSQTSSGFSSVNSNDTLNTASMVGSGTKNNNNNNTNNNPASNPSNGARTAAAAAAAATMMKARGIPQAIMNAKLMAPGAAAGVKGNSQPRIVPQAASPFDYYKNRKDTSRKRVLDKYDIIGYIAAGTYGRVYKATSKDPKYKIKEFAIKKFKVDSKDGEIPHYTGISQSACREMALCCELHHKNVTRLVEIILEDKCIYMIFEFAEHDLLQIIHYHSHPDRRPIPEATVKSILWQLLNGVSYLHQNWVLHRDLKPANIMVSTEGQVKIGDLGLARIFHKPQQSLYVGDKVVVTIWYRAPELLFGARHYTPAIDLWAVGCIFAELLALRPIFKGDEEKLDNKKNMPFQRNQIQKIIDVLGTPSKEKWPDLPSYPEYPSLSTFKQYPNNLESWYYSVGATSPKGLTLLSSLFEYDPTKRITAEDALKHPYFSDPPRFTEDAFASQEYRYPRRGIQTEDVDIKTSSQPNSKRLIADDRSTAASKKKKRK